MSADTLVVLATLASHGAEATRAVKELAASTRLPYDLCLVVDEAVGMQGWWDGMTFGDDRLMFLSPERRGLVGAYNVGFTRFLLGDDWRYLHLLEDGVRHTGGALDRMCRTLEAHPEFGWVGCGQVENASAPFTTYCSLMSRACVEKVRGLDPLFAPDQFDDSDLWMRCTVAGFQPHAIVNKVHHPESRTGRWGTEAEDIQRMLEHRELFRQRWGVPDFPWADVPVHQPCGVCQ